jgi:hypothetical protein
MQPGAGRSLPFGHPSAYVSNAARPSAPIAATSPSGAAYACTYASGIGASKSRGEVPPRRDNAIVEATPVASGRSQAPRAVVPHMGLFSPSRDFILAENAYQWALVSAEYGLRGAQQ